MQRNPFMTHGRVVIPREQYLFDGGQSHEIQTALQEILDHNRAALHADFALITYRPYSAQANLIALAYSSTQELDFPRPNEPLTVSDPLSGRLPSLVVDMTIRALLRRRSILLTSAVIIPWRDEYGSGSVITGNLSTRRVPLPKESDRHSHAISSAVQSGRASGSAIIKDGLHAALREVAEANATLPDAELRLHAILQSAKALFSAEVSYLAMPERDHHTFRFAQTLGITTSAFRGLRVEEGHGLGGLARVMRNPVRSLNYFRDDRLRSAPVAETRAEGIISAMAAPLILDEQVSGLIYVGDRSLRAFTETDERILEEFAQFAMFGVEQNMMDVYRRQVVKREERERLAFAIHDSVVRRLVEIGFVVEEGRRSTPSATVQQHYAAIEQATRSAMDALRSQLSQLLADDDIERVADAREVMNRIKELRHFSGISRSHGENIEPSHGTLSVLAADTLVRVGQEAIVNAERHSQCTHIHVQLDLTEATATLTIRDNGTAMTPVRLHQMQSTGTSHFGVRGMQDAVRSVDGHLSFPSAPQVASLSQYMSIVSVKETTNDPLLRR